MGNDAAQVVENVFLMLFYRRYIFYRMYRP